jgi:hypothetical protein
MTEESDKITVPEENISDEEGKISEESLSIREFIEKKKLQNRILGEIIEKIKAEDPNLKTE